jgi:ribose 5-phosphate isomerase B
MSNSIKIAIGADHAGFELKKQVLEFIDQQGFAYKDFGTYDEQSVDYPDFAHPVADAVESGLFDFGILICGSGNGVAIAANKHKDIRAALCWTGELAALARQHNNANILCLPARFVSAELALEITFRFFDTFFEGGRHQRRIEKINRG